MSATSTMEASPSPGTYLIPPLEPGDRLTRDEFERRYEALPKPIKAELIEGTVYMPSPVTHNKHGKPHFDTIAWLGVYQSQTPGVVGGDNSTVRLDIDNEPQPDALLMIDPKLGGQAQVSEDDYLEGAPELIVEVAATSASYDLHDKLNAYRRNRVREYVVWRVLDDAVDWFVFRSGEYVRAEPDAAGRYRSEVFPGLWLDAEALVSGDMAKVLECVQEGLASPEHRDFVDQLRRVGERE